MKKKIIAIFVAIIAISISASAQAPLPVGGSQINAGFGTSTWGIPIYGGVEFGVAENITVGGEIFYSSYSETFTVLHDVNKWKYTIFTLAGTGNYHFNDLLEIPSEWDVYAGLALGYAIFGFSYQGTGAAPTYPGTAESMIYLNGQIGGRYFFNDNWGVNLQFGLGNTTGGRIGITYIP